MLIKVLHTIILEGILYTMCWKRKCFYLIECAILNGYVLDGFVQSAAHA